MAQLRKFEIDAVIDTISSKVKEKNDSIKISDIEIAREINIQCPGASKLKKLDIKIKELEDERQIIVKNIIEEFDIYRYTSDKDVYDRLYDKIKDQVIKRNGFIKLDRNEIANKIIIMSSEGSLSDIIDTLLKELKL
jgi:hypothetical protein